MLSMGYEELLVTTGHPELIAAISSEIPEADQFLRPLHGTGRSITLNSAITLRQPDGVDHERIGWSGDFYTSSDVYPILGVHLPRRSGKWTN